MHWPKISEKKKKELDELKKSLHASPTRMKKSPSSNYASEAYKKEEAFITGRAHNRANSDNEGEHGSLKRKKILWADNPLKPKPKPKKELVIKDYLREFRIKNELDR